MMTIPVRMRQKAAKLVHADVDFASLALRARAATCCGSSVVFDVKF